MDRTGSDDEEEEQKRTSRLRTNEEDGRWDEQETHVVCVAA